MANISDFMGKYPCIDISLFEMNQSDYIDLDNMLDEFCIQYIKHVDNFMAIKYGQATTYYMNTGKFFSNTSFRLAFIEILGQILVPMMRYLLFFTFKNDISDPTISNTKYFDSRSYFISPLSKLPLSYSDVIDEDMEEIEGYDPNLSNFVFKYMGTSFTYTDILLSFVVNTTPDVNDEYVATDNMYPVGATPGTMYSPGKVAKILLDVMASKRMDLFRKTQYHIMKHIQETYQIYAKRPNTEGLRFTEYCMF